MTAPTQPDQAEGERKDEPKPGQGGATNQGISAEDPAEGGDDVPAGAPGAPRG